MKKSRLTSWIIMGLFWTVGILFDWASPLYAATDIETLAGRIARSVQERIPSHYHTIAISRIKKQNRSTPVDINELIDYSNVKIVQTRKFRVTDRSKLQLILNEQRIQLSEFVTPNEYKELGQVLGVQLFLYGTLFSDSLLLKAIDIQNSSIAWADVFAIEPNSINHLLLYDLGQNLTVSLRKETPQLKEENIRKISFWNLDVPRRFTSTQVMDYMTTAISKSQLFTVIDRENLKMITQEQKLNQAIFIDETQARQLGQLYGVDAFLYGTITHKGNHAYIASLKMMNIYSGVIVWADLVNFTLPPKETGKLENPFDKKKKERQQKSKTPVGMVQIPEGAFTMGSDDPLYNSSPARTVRLKAFWLDAYEVTNEQYLQFVETKPHRAPTTWENGIYDPALKDHPVVGVSWEDAKLYCEFHKKRLPSEAEWERAIRGPEGRSYPWNSPNFSPNFTVTLESRARGPVSIKTAKQDVTPEMIYHLAGNVREYVEDIYRPYEGTASSSTKERVVRGSSWAHGQYEAVGFFRGQSLPNLAWPDVGFRCAR